MIRSFTGDRESIFNKHSFILHKNQGMNKQTNNQAKRAISLEQSQDQVQFTATNL